ncbi:hypothetical protein AJ79_09809 [Helicocarpus griseus UAMH5409]|uniref:Zn(2)-C6 fungal-type domain-containing protein n=1 Tax=Helicocarpus griseus UAMH5409 TaxID=1447875 RepID=A0A2B7WHC2_9EURO|nr:hypothetical protein AJ79_09809 [Helicocarpus griseus UAMH5409]
MENLNRADALAIPATPRKKRRRTAASGAANDCFPCASYNIKCDRQRPYCTQCLDSGIQCSGYKTTLTWGVGVASRGKLRGLSWPVSGSQQEASATVAASTRNATDTQRPPPQSQPRAMSAVEPLSEHFGCNRSDPSNATEAITKKTGTPSRDVDAQYLPSLPSISASTYRAGKAHWSSTGPVQWQQHRDLSPQQVNAATPVLPYLNNSTQVPKPMPEFDCSRIIPQVPCLEMATMQTMPAFQTTAREIDANGMGSNLGPWAHIPNLELQRDDQRQPPLSQSVTSHPWSQESEFDGGNKEVEERTHGNFSSYPSLNPNTTMTDCTFQNGCASSQILSIAQPIFGQVVGRTPRMRYLISYYAEVITPVIVAFDGPTNPYRLFILELARGSDSLQHAIAALSLSNLRQRKKHRGLSSGKTPTTRKSSDAYCRMTERSYQGTFGISSPEEELREESFHKAMAIRSLNSQLEDPIKRREDSVLATLLLLCLYYMCDTGVAKLQTQLAGVKKLLALRGRDSGKCSDVVKWYTRVFAWFDVMTSTVNNREGELTGSYLDIAASGHDDWNLENLAGCDAQLFTIVAQLSRLNMLSQNRAVEPATIEEWPIATAPLPPELLHFNPNPPLFDDVYNPSHCEEMATVNDFYSRTQFWREWHVLHQKLESWRLQLPISNNSTTIASTAPSLHYPQQAYCSSTPFNYLSPPSSPPPYSFSYFSSLDITELSSISESFRYSALLYLERIANPQLPSSHPRIQRLVCASLHYINAVKADVYLLWPLFVTGAECTNDGHRALIRQRCSDIQKDSGFVNNLSCLKLLEKIWTRENDESVSPSLLFPTLNANKVNSTRACYGWENEGISVASDMMSCSMTQGTPIGGEAFKWRKVIGSEGADGDYIVV